MWAKMDRTDRITKQEILDFAQENGFRALDTELEPGDSYLAGRNTTVQQRVRMNEGELKWRRYFL